MPFVARSIDSRNIAPAAFQQRTFRLVVASLNAAPISGGTNSGGGSAAASFSETCPSNRNQSFSGSSMSAIESLDSRPFR